jgi:hypothetical protein
MDYASCTLEIDDSKVVVKENRSKFEVVNSSRMKIKKIQVDGCLINDARERCDWILDIPLPINRVLFVELKGCDVDKAISQLKSTLKYTSSDYSGRERECFIVTTRVPKFGPSMQKKCIQFFRDTSTKLQVKNSSQTIKI